MPPIHRRTFLVSAAAATAARAGTHPIDRTLLTGIAERKIPAVSAMFSSERKTLYAGAFGQRDSTGVPATTEQIYSIASMTKAVTTVAALQMVEQGKADLDEPVRKHLPQLADLDLIEGFDSAGKPSLRPATTPITLRQLLTHTCGLCYDIWDPTMFRYTSLKLPASKPGPLIFEPGARWQYGQGIDWAGRLVEALTGTTLEAYFQEKICKPLGMVDTSYILPVSKFDRLVTGSERDESGVLKQVERKPPTPPKSFNGGGGLYSTVADYTRFMQMILNHGAAPNGPRILQAKTVDLMMTNQIGALTAGKMKTSRPTLSADVDVQPGHSEKWTLGFLLNTDPYAGGRAAGSLAWAGIFNTFYWIDPKRSRCGVIMMQFLPFVDKDAVALLDAFERAAYANS